MSVGLSQQLQHTLHLKVNPKQIAANCILQMSSVDLQEARVRVVGRQREKKTKARRVAGNDRSAVLVRFPQRF